MVAMRRLVPLILTLTLSGCSIWLDYDSIEFEDDDASISDVKNIYKDGSSKDAKLIDGGLDGAEKDSATDGGDGDVAPRVDCKGVANGTAVIDACGVCGGDGTSCADCKGVPHGTAVEDVCGVCDGDGTSCLDCRGVVNGPAQLDVCGVCEGDGTSCLDCNNVPNGGAVVDACGVCGGEGKSCSCKPGTFCERIVDSHNKVRQSINEGSFMGEPKPSSPLPMLTWDPKLAAVAANYAKNCIWEHNGNRERDYAAQGGSGYVGENLAVVGGSKEPSTDKTVIDQWSSEAQHYNYSSNSCQSGEQCGHYTQVVWSATLRVGCAIQYCSSWATSEPGWAGMFTVCNYAPGGNYEGQRPY